MRFFIGVLCTVAVITLFKAIHVALFGQFDATSWWSGYITGGIAVFVVAVIDIKLNTKGK
ncbi:hypothetical protein [Listeria floridensis]|uniref:hypothetical protein n=1 Tax=Listeria floridensis TaxID=1494962 RepID=UPI00056A74A7|nr:hypothetical protein [Listeria floridensis]